MARESESGPLRWVATGNPPGGNMPEWARSAAMAGDGTVFAPAAMTDDPEMFVVLKAGWAGGVPLVTDDGHAYLPTWWLAREYPDVADTCRAIEAKLTAHFAGKTP
jgi:hypothetical protein